MYATPQKSIRVGSVTTPRQMDLMVAQGGYTREVRACAVFCFEQDYPTEFPSFYERFLQDFTLERTRAFVGSGTGASQHFVVHGKRKVDRPRSGSPVSIAHIERANALRQAIPYDIELYIGNYVHLLEKAFKKQRFSVVGRQWRSWMTVYQEPKRGHCYFVSVLNLLLHIPGVRNHVLARFQVPQGATDEDLFLDRFLSSPLGHKVWTHYSYAVTELPDERDFRVDENEYNHIVRNRTKEQLDDVSLELLAGLVQQLDGQGHRNGGFADHLLNSFLEVLGLEDDIVLLGGFNIDEMSIDEAVLSVIASMYSAAHGDPDVCCAFLLSGESDPETWAGHCLALVYDGDGAVVYDYGFSATTTDAIASFVRAYPVNFRCVMYEYRLPRRNLLNAFDAVATPHAPS